MELPLDALVRRLRGVAGAALFETLLLMGTVTVPLFLFHLDVAREARVKLERLQRERLKYDGSGPWTG